MANGFVDGIMQGYRPTLKPFTLPVKILAGSFEKAIEVLGIDFLGELKMSPDAILKSTSGIFNVLVLEIHSGPSPFLQLNNMLAEPHGVTGNHCIHGGFQSHNVTPKTLAMNLKVLASALLNSISVQHN